MQAVLERVEVRPGDADPAPQAGPLRLIRPVQEHLRRLRGLQGSILHHLCVTGNGDSIRLELPWSNMYVHLAIQYLGYGIFELGGRNQMYTYKIIKDSATGCSKMLKQPCPKFRKDHISLPVKVSGQAKHKMTANG